MPDLNVTPPRFSVEITDSGGVALPGLPADPTLDPSELLTLTAATAGLVEALIDAQLDETHDGLAERHRDLTALNRIAWAERLADEHRKPQ
ncbi:hypothetical protein [Gordonia sp. DT101]|uniref:hypothetical protein n=1 Tax=Gordonia sp. DT101 TaxID=3416545 RepID=UPI003CF7A3C2